MNGKTLGLSACLAGVLLVQIPLAAHHGGTTLYDLQKEVTMKVVITEFVWANPHVWIGFDATDEKGVARRWLLEDSSPPVLVNRGMSRKSLKPGDAVTITFNPGRKGYIGRTVKIVMADGKTFTR